MHRFDKGFSLVELMIMVGLLGGLAVAGMSLFKNQSAAQKTIERNFEVATVINEIRGVLSNPANCTATFGGLNPSNATVNQIKKDINSVFTNVYPINVVLPGTILIKSYRLKNSYTNLASNETVLEILFSRGKGTIKDDYLRQVKLIYTLSGSNILSCYASASSVDSLWEISSSEPNDIFYNSGEVGIGTSNPLARLHIRNDSSGPVSGIFLQNNNASGGRTFSLASRVDFGLPRFSISDEVSGFERFVVSNTGQIGIGTNNPNAGSILSINHSGSNFNALNIQDESNLASSTGIYLRSTTEGRITVGTGGAITFRRGGLPGVEEMRIDSSGNLGVGTSSPETQLHVKGAVSSNGGALYVQDSGSSTGTGGLVYFGNSAGAFVSLKAISEMNSPNPKGTLALSVRNATTQTNLTEAMRIDSMGRVMIGSTTPAARLRVNGEINIGDSGMSCDSSVEGSLRYSSTLKQMMFCNGTVWKSFIPTPVVVTANYRGSAHGYVNCPAGTVVVGGGCDFDSDNSGPDISTNPTSTGWHCWGADPDGDRNIYVYAICI